MVGPQKCGTKPRKKWGPKKWAPKGGEGPEGWGGRSEGWGRGGGAKGGRGWRGGERWGWGGGGRSEGWGGGGAKGGGPKISRFLTFSQFFIVFSFLVGPSWIWWCLKRRVCVWSSRAVEPETPNVHILGSQCFKHHPNSTRRHPEKDKKSENGAGERQKRAKFWAVRRRGSQPTTTPPTRTTTTTTTTLTSNFGQK